MNSNNRASQIGLTRFCIALHALFWLGQRKCVVPSASIAYEVNLHATVLRKVMKRLVQAGIVEAKEGRDGGYLLKVQPNKLALADVYVAMKLDAAEMESTINGGESSKKAEVILVELMQEIEGNTIAFLSDYTLADLMNRCDELI
ncbi:RrF2 family transcriptional regulator [Paenibacillus sp. NPDC058174]|uniref:RrF2 family transcriptional regulator n=1 Tax=Paenibacillus sp. NPDC058174 TaxID=3346366 RepID=UPI0036DAAF6A